MRIVKIIDGKEQDTTINNLTRELAEIILLMQQKWFPNDEWAIREDKLSATRTEEECPSPFPVAMGTGDPGVRASIQAERNGQNGWSEEQEEDWREDGGYNPRWD